MHRQGIPTDTNVSTSSSFALVSPQYQSNQHYPVQQSNTFSHAAPNSFPSDSFPVTTCNSTTDLAGVSKAIQTQEQTLKRKTQFLTNLSFTIDELHKFTTSATQRYKLHSTLVQSYENDLENQQAKNVQNSNILHEISTQLEALKSFLSEVERREPKACAVLVEEQQILTKAKSLLQELCHNTIDPASNQSRLYHIIHQLRHYLPLIQNRTKILRSSILSKLRTKLFHQQSTLFPSVNKSLSNHRNELDLKRSQLLTCSQTSADLTSKLEALTIALSSVEQDNVQKQQRRSSQSAIVANIQDSSNGFISVFTHVGDLHTSLTNSTVQMSQLQPIKTALDNQITLLNQGIAEHYAKNAELTDQINNFAKKLLTTIQSSASIPSISNDAQFASSIEQLSHLSTIDSDTSTDSLSDSVNRMNEVNSQLEKQMSVSAEQVQTTGFQVNTVNNTISQFLPLYHAQQAALSNTSQPSPPFDTTFQLPVPDDDSTTSTTVSTMTQLTCGFNSFLQHQNRFTIAQQAGITQLQDQNASISAQIRSGSDNIANQSQLIEERRTKRTQLISQHDMAVQAVSAYDGVIKSINSRIEQSQHPLRSLTLMESKISNQLEHLKEYRTHRIALRLAKKEALRKYNEELEAERQREAEAEALVAQLTPKVANLLTPVQTLSKHLVSPSSVTHKRKTSRRSDVVAATAEEDVHAEEHSIIQSDEIFENASFITPPATNLKTKRTKKGVPAKEGNEGSVETKQIKSIIKKTAISFNDVPLFKSPPLRTSFIDNVFSPQDDDSDQMDDLTLQNTFYNQQITTMYPATSPSPATSLVNSQSQCTPYSEHRKYDGDDYDDQMDDDDLFDPVSTHPPVQSATNPVAQSPPATPQQTAKTSPPEFTTPKQSSSQHEMINSVILPKLPPYTSVQPSPKRLNDDDAMFESFALSSPTGRTFCHNQLVESPHHPQVDSKLTPRRHDDQYQPNINNAVSALLRSVGRSSRRNSIHALSASQTQLTGGQLKGQAQLPYHAPLPTSAAPRFASTSSKHHRQSGHDFISQNSPIDPINTHEPPQEVQSAKSTQSRKSNQLPGTSSGDVDKKESSIPFKTRSKETTKDMTKERTKEITDTPSSHKPQTKPATSKTKSSSKESAVESKASNEYPQTDTNLHPDQKRVTTSKVHMKQRLSSSDDDQVSQGIDTSAHHNSKDAIKTKSLNKRLPKQSLENPDIDSAAFRANSSLQATETEKKNQQTKPNKQIDKKQQNGAINPNNLNATKDSDHSLQFDNYSGQKTTHFASQSQNVYQVTVSHHKLQPVTRTTTHPVVEPTTPKMNFNIMTPSDDPKTPRSQQAYKSQHTTTSLTMKQMYSQRQQQYNHGQSSARKLPPPSAGQSMLGGLLPRPNALNPQGGLPGPSQHPQSMLKGNMNPPPVLHRSGGVTAPGLLGKSAANSLLKSTTSLHQRGLSLQSKFNKKM